MGAGWPYLHKPPMGWPLDYDTDLVPDAGFWPMLVGSGNKVFDLSGNGNTGTLQEHTHFVPGKFGSALDFDGAGDDSVSTGSPIVPIGDYTLLAWIKLNVRDGEYVISQYAAAQSGRLVFGIEDTRTYVRHGGVDDAGSQVNTDQWYQIALTRSGSTLIYYLNSIVDPGFSITNATDNTYQGVNTTIGALEVGSNPLDGQIDHVMIYNRALSASEIALLYRKPFCMFRDPAEMILAAAGQTAAPPVGIIRSKINGGLANTTPLLGGKAA